MRFYGQHSCAWATHKQVSSMEEAREARTAGLWAWGKSAQQK